MDDAAESNLNLAVEQADEIAVFWMNTEGRIDWWSPGAERVFGYDSASIVGQHVKRLFAPEDRERGMPQLELAVADATGIGEDDRWHVRSDGSRFWGNGFVVATRDARGRLLGFAKVVRNRTDVKEQLEALRNRVKAEQEAGRRKDVFLATLAHELRNVLTPLTTGLEIIRRRVPATPELDLGMRIVARQAELMRSLVDDLLDLARINEGKIALALKRVALEHIVNQVIDAHRLLADKRRQKLKVLFPDVPTCVDVDPDRMQQVVTNLLSNAVKYTPEGGMISIKTTVEGNEAVMRIEDSGVGIPPHVQPVIFDLFTQAEAVPGGAAGLGIGLSLVKDIVTLHGGSVQVRSDGIGKGSEFTVRLPLAIEKT